MLDSKHGGKKACQVMQIIEKDKHKIINQLAATTYGFERASLFLTVSPAH